MNDSPYRTPENKPVADNKAPQIYRTSGSYPYSSITEAVDNAANELAALRLEIYELARTIREKT